MLGLVSLPDVTVKVQTVPDPLLALRVMFLGVDQLQRTGDTEPGDYQVSRVNKASTKEDTDTNWDEGPLPSLAIAAQP